MRKRVQEHIWPAGKSTLALAVRHPALVPNRQSIEPLLDPRLTKPFLHGVRAKLQEHTFATILDSGKPLLFKRELRALNVALVLSVDVGRDRFEARESGQGHDFPEPIKLNDGSDPI